MSKTAERVFLFKNLRPKIKNAVVVTENYLCFFFHTHYYTAVFNTHLLCIISVKQKYAYLCVRRVCRAEEDHNESGKKGCGDPKHVSVVVTIKASNRNILYGYCSSQFFYSFLFYITQKPWRMEIKVTKWVYLGTKRPADNGLKRNKKKKETFSVL